MRSLIYFLMITGSSHAVYAATDSLASIHGQVTNLANRKPIRAVAIFLEPGNIFTETNQDGYFQLMDLKPGNYHLLIQRIGFVPERQQSVKLHPGEIKRVDIDLKEKILEVSDPIIVTARRNPYTTMEIPYSKDIVTPEHLNLLKPLNLSEALKNIQGTFIKDYGGLGDLKTISLRGSGAEQVLVMLDGQRLNNPQTGQVDLSSLRLDGIEKIEILRGGRSAMYGSDAVGGVVNIITRKRKETDGLNASFEVLGGSFHMHSLIADLGLNHDWISASLGYRELKSDGDFTFLDIQNKERQRENNNVSSQNFFTDLNLKLKELPSSLDLNITYRYFNAEHGTPGTIEMPSLTARQWDRNHQLQGLLRGKIFNGLNDFRFQVYMHQSRSGYKSNDGLVPIDSKFRSGSNGIEYNMETILTPHNSLIYGLGIKQDRLEDLQLASEHSRQTYYVFLQDEATILSRKINFPISLILIPALRFDNYSDLGSHWSPKFGGIISHGKEWQTMIKFNTGISFRAPTFNELYWPADIWSGGNADLKPERGFDWDLGLNLRYPVLDGLAFDIVYFDMRMRDLILWQPVNQIWQPENIARSRNRGIEISSTLALLQESLKLSGNYTLLDATNQSDVPALKDKYLVYRPGHIYNLILLYIWQSFKFGLEYRYVGKRYTNPANTIYLEPYQVSDLTLQWQQKFANWQPGIRLQIKNILNSSYQVIRFQPMPGREIRIGLTIRYN